VYAASAHAKGGKPEDGIIDIEGTERVIPVVFEECRLEPQASFWQKLKGAWAKVESEAKAAAKKVESKL
jgi:acid stress chaperone HdeA